MHKKHIKCENKHSAQNARLANSNAHKQIQREILYALA